MLTFKLRSVSELGWGSLLPLCVHTEQIKLVCGGKREDTSAAPEGKFTQLGSRLPPFLVPSQLHFCPQGPRDIPASQQ